MRVLVGMSGGVDSSVAVAELIEAGHEVVGVTMRLWGGESDTGCCSVSDVEDARRVAQQLGIDHVVFNFSADFDFVHGGYPCNWHRFMNTVVEHNEQVTAETSKAANE